MVRATDQLLLPLEIIFCPGVRKPLRCVSVRSPVPFHSSSIDLSIRRSFVRRPTIPFELSSAKRDNYFPEREGKKLIVRKKSSGNFEDPPPKTLARDLLTNAKFIYDLTVHIRGSHGQDLSFSGAAVDSIVDTWVNGGVVIVRNLEE